MRGGQPGDAHRQGLRPRQNTGHPARDAARGNRQRGRPPRLAVAATDLHRACRRYLDRHLAGGISRWRHARQHHHASGSSPVSEHGRGDGETGAGGTRRNRGRSDGPQAYSKVFFRYGRRVGGGVGHLRLAGGGCRCVVVGGLLDLAGRMRGVLSAYARDGPPGVAHRAGAFGATPALSRTAGRGRRRGPPVAGRRSGGWRGGGIRTGPRSARWRWPRWSGRPSCAAGCRHVPGSGPRRR